MLVGLRVRLVSRSWVLGELLSSSCLEPDKVTYPPRGGLKRHPDIHPLPFSRLRQGWGGVSYVMPSRSRMYDHRSSHPYNAGTEHVGCSQTRQTLLVPKRGRTSPAVWDGGRELNLHEALAVVHHDCFRLFPPKGTQTHTHVNAQRRGGRGV